MLRPSVLPRVLFVLIAVFFTPHFAHADASVAVQSLAPGAQVPIGTQVTFIVVGSEFNASLNYTLQDSFGGSSVTNANINSSGVFSWIPATADVGNHTITVTVNDGTGNSVQTSQALTVPPQPAVTIQNVSASTIKVPGTIFFSAVAVGFTNPQYSVVDTSPSSSLTFSNINSGGGFSWTSKEQDVGSHAIKVYVTDSLGHSASADFNATVTAPASLTMSPAIGTSTKIYAGTPLSLTLQTTDYTSPTYSVTDALPGSSLNNFALNMYTGIFSWTPKSNDLGEHQITFTANDYSNGYSAIIRLAVTVVASTSTSNTTPTQAVIPYSGPTTLFATTTTIGKSLPNVPGTPIMVNTNIPDLKFYFATNLAVGSSGTEVSALQNALMQLGFYSGPISGTFGPLTKSAVIAFQNAHGLEAVGNVGPITRAALNNSETSSSKAAPTAPSTSSGFAFTTALGLGSRGVAVTELQKRLIALGLLSGEPTGYFGQLTLTGVKAYQASKGLEPVGNLGPKTRTALNSSN